MSKQQRNYPQYPQYPQWDPLPMLVDLLPSLLEVLTQPVVHRHYHTHTHTWVQEAEAVNPYRQQRQKSNIPQTVGELEEWILSQPQDSDCDRLLQLLADYPPNTPISRIKHLLR